MPMCSISCVTSVASCRWSVASSSLDCNWRERVGAGVAETLFEFFAGADAFCVDDAVDGEDAVKVVDFVLHEFGEVAVVSGLEFESVAGEILIADGDVAVAFDLHEDGEETQAGVPDDYFFCAALNDFGIDQRPGLGFGEFEEDDALQHAELWSGDAASVAGFGAPVGEGVGEVLNQSADFARCGVLDGDRFLPEN